MEYRWLI